MKRALSLIIVLAMVLCMIPFSAFAANADIELAEGDFVDGVITLVGSEEQTYLYTATEDGTVEVFAEAVVPEVAEGEEAPALAQPYILVDGAEYTEAFAVTAGESYAITFGDEAMIGGEVTVWAKLTGLPGTESNPYDYYNPTSGLAPEDQAATTVSVEPGASVYYNLWYYNATTLRISGVGVKAVKVWEDKTIDGTEAGYVDFEIAAMERTVLIKITNKDASAQTYTFEGIVPSGTMNNPEVVTTGEYSANVAENGEYWYQYVATAAGKLSIGVAATTTVTDEEGNESVVDCWQYTVNPMSGGETHYCDDEEIVNPETIDVVAGDKVVFVVATYSSTSRPAATVKTTVSFEEAVEGPIVIESLPYTAVHSGTYEQEYSYTATEDCWLYVTTTGDSEGGYINFNSWGAEVYGDGNVYKLTAGQSVGIILSNYSWGPQDVEYTYEFSALTEIEPDGSNAFPFVADIPSDGTVVTLANDGENPVYYAYTATEDCKIYNAFYESTVDVAAGETTTFYVPAGGIQVNYVIPVAELNGDKYYSVAEALAKAVSGDTVTMLADSHEETATLVIEEGVTLNIGANDLYAKGILGYTGGVVRGTPITSASGDYGKIYVSSKTRMVIENDVIQSDSTNFDYLPMWDTDESYYFFGGFVFKNVTAAYSHTITEDAIDVAFTPSVDTYFRDNILRVDSWDDLGVTILLRLTWKSGNGIANQDFVYTSAYIEYWQAKGGKFTFNLPGWQSLNILEEDLTVTPVIVTDCGTELLGVLWDPA